MSKYSLDDFTSKKHITNTELLAYALSHVNLPPDLVKRYRGQANSLRERLEGYIKDHPDYDLVKMLHSGSLAKGSAIRKINDIDTAIYVKAAAVRDQDRAGLIAWLHDRLKEVYPDFDDDQLEPHDHCVTVHYKTPGLIKVDVVPVLYEGDPDNKGFLITKDPNSDPVLTSISLHIEFIRNRKARQPDTYIQFVRFVKWWAWNKKTEYKAANKHFRFKSLLAELICAHLADNGLDTSDYTAAMQQFFAYIVRTGLKEPIFFTDYYGAGSIDLSSDALIQIFDPVNPQNNIASTYTEQQRQQIVDEAARALDALTTAATADTKGEAVSNWQVVLGTTFRG
ncbi:MAG TPA: CBASS oligonucleotide cyclase [Candidatus Saccharimonadales bacterium]|nr:CBASS oligonucleotide cyclase [Candidatus Saccharimonadales bacterium]